MEEQVFQKLKNRENMELMILLHELGHYRYHHRSKKHERLTAMRNHTVQDCEKEADEFAAGYSGYQAAADALEQLPRENRLTYEGDDYDPEEAELSCKEIEMRISLLREGAKKQEHST